MKRLTKDKMKRFSKGAISVFLAFVLTGVLSLAALIVETSRYQTAIQQLDEASINSALSVLAGYDTDLEKRFGLYGIDSEKTSAEDIFSEYLHFNSENSTSATYSAGGISKLYDITSTGAELKYDLANYQVLKRQILENQKYRAPLNMASEVIDIDEMIKELTKSLDKALGLENFLKICDAISDIAEAFKKIYCLYKDVEQLQLTIGGADSVGEKLNEAAGKVWECCEKWLGGEEWPVHDPTYDTAFDEFQTAVNNKVTYMKENQEPDDPGPQPHTDSYVNDLYNTYVGRKTNHEVAVIIFDILQAAIDCSYVDDNGIVDKEKKISDLLEDENITIENLKKVHSGLSKNSTREDLLKKVNEKAITICGVGLNDYKKTTIKGYIDNNKAQKINALKSTSDGALSNYNSAKRELNDWKNKKTKYDAYNTAIDNYNQNIKTTKNQLKQVVETIVEELGDYKKSLTDVTEALDKAADAIGSMNEAIDKMGKESEGNKNTSDKDGKDKKEDESSKKDPIENVYNGVKNTENEVTAKDGAIEHIFDAVKKEIQAAKIELTDEGLSFLANQRRNLEALSTDDINENYNFDSVFTTGDLLTDPCPYFMSKAKVTGFLTTLAAMDLLEGIAQDNPVKIAIDFILDMINTMQPIPYQYNFDCKVELNTSTTRILPSKINGGAGTTEPSDSSDIVAIAAMVNEARESVGSAYLNDINAVDPNLRIEEQEPMSEVTERITRLSTNMNTLITAGIGILGEGKWIVVTIVFRIFECVHAMIQIIKDLIYLSTHLTEVLTEWVQSLPESILLNQYVIDNFPNRVDKISSYSGYPRTFTPDNDSTVQTFSGACVEYVIAGTNSERKNQAQCFWSIFAIRALDNALTIIFDESVMSIIGATNLAAPLVFLLWVYLETNIDMNKLLSDEEVPLIKFEICLSPTTIANNATDILNAWKSTSKTEDEAIKKGEDSIKVDTSNEVVGTLLKTEGLIKMKYKYYLWLFMLFVPNQTEVMRIADLIQMEMRYKKLGKSEFLLKNVHTYVRCEASGELNSILPVLSLNDNSLNGKGIELTTVKYVGY